MGRAGLAREEDPIFQGRGQHGAAIGEAQAWRGSRRRGRTDRRSSAIPPGARGGRRSPIRGRPPVPCVRSRRMRRRPRPPARRRDDRRNRLRPSAGPSAQACSRRCRWCRCAPGRAVSGSKPRTSSSCRKALSTLPSGRAAAASSFSRAARDDLQALLGEHGGGNANDHRLCFQGPARRGQPELGSGAIDDAHRTVQDDRQGRG